MEYDRMSALRFEDLRVWKKSAILCSEIYKVLISINDFAYRNQITRAALSISSNIAEGFERESDKECIRFLMYAKGSCGELRSQIYIGMKIDYIDKNTGHNWLKAAIEISEMLSALVKTKRNFIKLKQNN